MLLSKQKSPLIQKALQKVLKEAYLWMGDKFSTIMADPGMDPSTKAELQKYIEGVSKSEMKEG